MSSNPTLRSRGRDALPAVLQVVPHGKMGEEARFLEDIAAGALVRGQEASARLVLPALALHRDVAGGCAREPGEAAQHRGFSGAGGAE